MKSSARNVELLDGHAVDTDPSLGEQAPALARRDPEHLCDDGREMERVAVWELDLLYLLGRLAFADHPREVLFGPLGRLKPDDIAALVGNAFIGSEALLLLGFEGAGMPIRRALRRFGALLRNLEEVS